MANLEFPDENEERDKMYIIANSPVLRVFSTYEEGVDRKVWLKNVEDKVISTWTRIEEPLKISLNKEAEESINAGLSQHIFDENLEKKDMMTAINALTLIGYEMSTGENVELFYGDIYELLVNLKILRNTLEGAWITRAILLNSAQHNLDNIPPEFRNFRFD